MSKIFVATVIKTFCLLQITNLKGMYENEISEARRLLDELAKEKAQLQIEGSSLKDRADAEKTR